MTSRARTRRLPSVRSRCIALSAVLLLGAAWWNGAQAQSPAGTPPLQAQAPVPAAPDHAARVRLSSSQMQQAFRYLDVNSDGRITRDELKGFPRIDRHFERIDINRDGSVSPVEFEDALQQAS